MIILILSMWGKLPKSLVSYVEYMKVYQSDMKAKTWGEAEKHFPDIAVQKKTGFRQQLLLEKLNELPHDSPVTLKSVASKILDYCDNLTESSRKFMIDFPNKKLPNDYVAYPGKMDHATVVALRIGMVEGEENTTSVDKTTEQIVDL